MIEDSSADCSGMAAPPMVMSGVCYDKIWERGGWAALGLSDCFKIGMDLVSVSRIA